MLPLYIDLLKTIIFAFHCQLSLSLLSYFALLNNNPFLSLWTGDAVLVWWFGSLSKLPDLVWDWFEGLIAHLDQIPRPT